MNSRIKLSARAALSGSYFRVIPVLTAMMFLTLVFAVCNLVFNRFFSNGNVLLTVGFYLVFLLVFVAIISPLRLNLEMKHFALAVRNISAPKACFKVFLKSCGMTAILFIFKAFSLFVYEFIPIVSTVIFGFYLSQKSVSAKAFIALFAGVSAAFLIGLFFYFLTVQRYSKAMFFLVCYENLGVLDAIKESVRKTQNKCGEILLFKLGFLPWFLLCIAVVPALFVIPYYKQSITCRFLNDR